MQTPPTEEEIVEQLNEVRAKYVALVARVEALADRMAASSPTCTGPDCAGCNSGRLLAALAATDTGALDERLAKAWNEGRASASVMLPTMPPQEPRNPYRANQIAGESDGN